LTKIIKIKTTNELKQFTNKLKSLARIMSTLQLHALEKTADESILNDIHKEMETQKISKKIIETTYVGPINIVQGKSATIHIISDYTSDDGFDVGKAREEGTKDHMVKPVQKKALSWIDGSTGKRRFDSKGHMVSGLPRLLIIEKAISKNKQKIKDSYEKNIVSSYKQILGV